MPSASRRVTSRTPISIARRPPDRLAVFVDATYKSPGDHSGAEVLAGRGGSAERKKDREFSFGRAFIVFQFVALSWVFFRAASAADATLILQRITTAFLPATGLTLPGLSTLELTVALLLIAALFLTEWLARKRPVWERLAAQPRWLRWGACYLFAVAFLALVLTGPQHQAQPFIYFQF